MAGLRRRLRDGGAHRRSRSRSGSAPSRTAELRARARPARGGARTEVGELDRRARDLDMRVYEQQVSLQAVRDRALGDLGLDAEALAAAAVDGLDRPEEERRLAAAERRLARLGRVNPLALEEFAALEQRHTFLGEQLADLHRTRADLLKIVEDLDRRMHEIFSAAYARHRGGLRADLPGAVPRRHGPADAHRRAATKPGRRGRGAARRARRSSGCPCSPAASGRSRRSRSCSRSSPRGRARSTSSTRSRRRSTTRTSAGCSR